MVHFRFPIVNSLIQNYGELFFPTISKFPYDLVKMHEITRYLQPVCKQYLFRSAVISELKPEN